MNRIPSLAHLFSTNAPVLPEERSVLVKEVEVIDQTIDELRQRMDALERDRRDCLAVLSPIRVMPAEVLATVFAFTVDPRRIEQNEDVRKQVIDICLVCKAWRQSATSAHQLWTSLAIATPFTMATYEKAERWLGRAGVLPKRLALNSPKDDCEWYDFRCALTGSNQILAKFLVQGPALNDLSISCRATTCLRGLLGRMRELTSEEHHWSLSSIKCLSITVTSYWNELEDRRTTWEDDIFAHLPLAPSFHLSVPFGYDGNGGNQMLSIPPTFLSQMTDFTLSCDWNAVKILKPLNFCNQLRTLTLDFKARPLQFDRTAWLEDANDRIVLPELSTLRFLTLHPSAFKHITPYIKTPRLLELDMSFADSIGGRDDTLNHLGKLLVASGCNAKLRRIQLHDFKVDLEDMTSFLEETDLVSLEHLTLDKVAMPASLFTYLLTHMDSLPLSRLQIIELVNMPERSLIALARTYVQARRDMDDRSETRLVISSSS